MQVNAIERAFELARSGSVRSVDDIRRKLKSERFEQVEVQLAGGAINKQLKGLIKAAKTPS